MSTKASIQKALQERNFDQATRPLSAKRMLSYQIEKAMAARNINRVDMAAQMETSRAALNRLLDPANNSVTLHSIQSAADVLDLEIVISLKPKD